jgi:hypothetical protein
MRRSIDKEEIKERLEKEGEATRDLLGLANCMCQRTGLWGISIILA